MPEVCAGDQIRLEGRAFALPLFLVPLSTFTKLRTDVGDLIVPMPHEPSQPPFISLGSFPDDPTDTGPDPVSIRFHARIPSDVPPGRYLVTIYCATCGPRGTLIPDAGPAVNPQVRPVRVLAAATRDGFPLGIVAGVVAAAVLAVTMLIALGATVRRRRPAR